MGYPRQRLGQRAHIARRGAPEPAQQRRAFHFVNHIQRIVPRDGAKPQSHVVVHFHHNAANAEQQNRPQLCVVRHAHDGFHAARRHLLHGCAVNAGISVVTPRIGGDGVKSAAHLFRVGQAEPYPAGLGFVPDVRRVDFYRHGIADAVGGGYGGVSVGRRRVLRRRDAKGGNQPFAGVFRQCAVAGQRRRRGRLCGGHCRRIGKAPAQAALPPVVIVVQATDAGGQLVRRVEHRNAGLTQHRQAGCRAPRPRPQKGHRLAAALPLRDDLRRLGIRAGRGHHQRAYAFVRRHIRHNRRKIIAVGIPGYIRRVCRPAESFEYPVNAVPGLFRQRRQVQPGLSEHIRRQAADAAGMRHHRYAAARRPGAAGQQVGHLQQVVIVLHPNYPILSESGVIHGVNPGQRRRVRTRGAGTQLGAANLDEDNGLAPFHCQPGQRRKLAPVLKPLDKAGNNPRVVIIQQVAGEIAEIQVGFVAGRYDVGKSDALVHRPRQKRPKGRCPALAHQPYRPAQSRRAAR